MAEKPKGGKKIAGVSEKTLGLSLGGAVLVYLIYRWYQSKHSGSASGVGSYAPAIAPGSGTSTGSGAATSSGSGSTFSSLSGWEQAVMNDLRSVLGGAGALNAVTDWLNGSCVSAKAYTALGNSIQTHGLPPGFGGNVPTLSICPAGGAGASGTTGSGSGTAATGTGSTVPATTTTTSTLPYDVTAAQGPGTGGAGPGMYNASGNLAGSGSAQEIAAEKSVAASMAAAVARAAAAAKAKASAPPASTVGQSSAVQKAVEQALAAQKAAAQKAAEAAAAAKLKQATTVGPRSHLVP